MASMFLSSLSSLKTTDESKKLNIVDGVDLKTRSKANARSVLFENDVLLVTIDDILSSKQCDKMLKNLSTASSFQSMNKKYEREIRNSSRLLTVDKNISNMLWKRMQKIIEKTIESKNISIVPLGFDVLDYEWKLNGINDGIRINSYNQKDQFFSYHKDGIFYIISMKTKHF